MYQVLSILLFISGLTFKLYLLHQTVSISSVMYNIQYNTLYCPVSGKFVHGVRIWASVKLGDTLGMPIWLETINGI